MDVSELIDRCLLAYQPIVEIHTGRVYAFEALLRGTAELGFERIHHFFDALYEGGHLHQGELLLRRKALEQRVSSALLSRSKLFLNMDNRLLESPDYSPGNTHQLLNSFGVASGSLYFEISERHSLTRSSRSKDILDHYRQRGYKIALDDYGTGYAGLQLLYHSEPDIIKIDRFFIEGVDTNPRKRLFVNHIVEMAHLLGSRVVAEGVEREEEYCVCREAGCDYAQGWLIAHAETDLSLLRERYPIPHASHEPGEKRLCPSSLLTEHMEERRALKISTPPEELLEYFKEDSRRHFAPLVEDDDRTPLGIIREENIKNILYSPYGHALMRNRVFRRILHEQTERVPSIEIYTPLDHILKIFAESPDLPGIIVTKDRQYRGILDPQELIRMLNAREIREARDLNPLTRLPGNQMIAQKLEELESQNFQGALVAYFDFDNFKPFNDQFGFRQGDRVIKMFGQNLREEARTMRGFAGHIGGDDFVLITDREAADEINGICRDFKEDAEMFFLPEQIAQGYYEGKDRYGKRKKLPLLSVSAAVLEFPEEGVPYTLDQLGRDAAALKKKAKASSEFTAKKAISKTGSGG